MFFVNLVLLMFFCEFLVGSIYSNNIILLMLFYEKMLILDIEIVCFIEVVRRYVVFFLVLNNIDNILICYINYEYNELYF